VSDLAVVYLARRQNGIAPFERFLASLRMYPPGVPHELVILCKGFDGNLATQYERLLEGVPHRQLFVSDRGFDINAYFEAVQRLEYTHFCFLNSYSQILVEGWLEKMRRWIDAEGVGLVGATGSCQSIAGGYTLHRPAILSLPSIERFRAQVARALAVTGPEVLMRRAALWALRRTGIWRASRDFPPFPNYHLRTNAFMGARQTLRRIRIEPMRMKLSAWKFESGKDSLTNQVRRLGLRVLVVGRDGEGYEPERWHLSNTFWQSREENLLVADNQTEFYLSADAATRAEFSQYAWGEFARPGETLTHG